MPKPLNLFIQPPFTDWTLVFTYGAEVPQPPAGPVIHNHLRLQTTGAGPLFAAADGKLSVRPPIGGILDPTDQIAPPDPGTPLPPTITLFLHLSSLVASQPTFRAQVSQINGITGWAYLNVETASLEAALAELLDKATIPPGTLTRADIVGLLVRGMLDVEVTAGHAIGNAAAQGASAGSRQIGFTALTSTGPMDLASVYDLMRDFVADSQSDLDDFIILAPKSWPVIEAALSTDQAIKYTQSVLYPMPVLENLRTRQPLPLSPAQWRQVGDNQKTLWRNRLLSRVGHAPPGSAGPPFAFDTMDGENIFQLEAVVEFYVNLNDPWRPGPPFTDGENKPRSPFLADGITPNPDYLIVDFLDPAGSAATVVGNVVTLDGAADLTLVRANYDTLFLSNDTAPLSPTHPNGLYRITAVSPATRTVTLQATDTPTLTGGSSPWVIKLRPTLVLIDSFGARDGLRGNNATASPAAPNVLMLDGPPDLSKVNPNFDTIYLPADTARPSQTYRIIALDNQAHTVTLDSNVALAGGASTWHIPAGISGELPALDYHDLGPGGSRQPDGTRGYDHYDGLLFIVQGGTIRHSIRWTSFTSCAYQAGSQNLSSVRGNEAFFPGVLGSRQYDFRSYRSPNVGSDLSTDHNKHALFRNYCFLVVDADSHYPVPGVRKARFYFSTPVTDDSTNGNPVDGGLGKTAVEIHRGTQHGAQAGSGSAGCLVSPSIFDLRNWLIAIYEEEYAAFYGPGQQDREVMKAFGSNDTCETLWKNTTTQTGPLAKRLADADWNDKIVGALWVIRPDERPLG